MSDVIKNNPATFISEAEIIDRANQILSNNTVHYFTMIEHSEIIYCINVIATILPYWQSNKNKVINSLQLTPTPSANITHYLQDAIISLINLERDINNKLKLKMLILGTLSLATCWNNLLINNDKHLTIFKSRRAQFKKTINSNIWNGDILPRILAKVFTDCNSFYDNGFMFDLFRTYRNSYKKHATILDIIAHYMRNHLIKLDIVEAKPIWNKILPELRCVFNKSSIIKPLMNPSHTFDITSTLSTKNKKPFNILIDNKFINDNYITNIINVYKKLQCLLDTE